MQLTYWSICTGHVSIHIVSPMLVPPDQIHLDCLQCHHLKHLDLMNIYNTTFSFMMILMNAEFHK